VTDHLLNEVSQDEAERNYILLSWEKGRRAAGMTFTNKEQLVEILSHARSQPRCVIEFQTNDAGETTVLDITEHVASLEELNE